VDVGHPNVNARQDALDPPLKVIVGVVIVAGLAALRSDFR
jgi:hypothetical protein